jgi:DNA-directed RNA polymerase specialized sigma24 family protein
VLQRARSADPELRARALETIAAVYWAPLYAHVRLTHRAERADAEDLVQGFFAEALRRDLVARWDAERGRFRTYLRACLDAHVANERKAARRLKRGGAAAPLSLDVAALERRVDAAAGAACDGPAGPDVDRVFHDEWVRAVFERALARFRARCSAAGRHAHLALFERYDLAAVGDADDDGGADTARPSYAQLAAELSITTTQVTNWLAAARRDFRATVLETLRELCAGDDEFREEARALLGVSVS